tara:strand:- start:200 stop:370 length:171 start_codon:yes stop_codon:yes gene_type:complete
MIEKIAQVFGMTFVGIILMCLVWTIISYMMTASYRKNKLKENMERFESTKEKRPTH